MAWEYFKLFHLLFAFAFFSGTIVATVAGMRAEKTDDVGVAETTMRMAKWASLVLIYPPLLLTVLFGALLTAELSIDLTGTLWLDISYVAIFAALALSITVFGGQGRRAEALFKVDVPAGRKSPELQAVLSERGPKIAGPVLHSLFVLVIVMMVFQPE